MRGKKEIFTLAQAVPRVASCSELSYSLKFYTYTYIYIYIVRCTVIRRWCTKIQIGDDWKYKKHLPTCERHRAKHTHMWTMNQHEWQNVFFLFTQWYLMRTRNVTSTTRTWMKPVMCSWAIPYIDKQNEMKELSSWVRARWERGEREKKCDEWQIY